MLGAAINNKTSQWFDQFKIAIHNTRDALQKFNRNKITEIVNKDIKNEENMKNFSPTEPKTINIENPKTKNIINSQIKKDIPQNK